jgi:hypothetical protein
MSRRAAGDFELKTWNEHPFGAVDGGPKLTRASVTNAYAGDIEGEGTLEYLMVYRDEEHASFVGFERVVGRVGGRSGSFVLRHEGTYEGDTATGKLSVVPDSGTADLRGLRGEGGYVAKHGKQPTPFTLDYDLG